MSYSERTYGEIIDLDFLYLNLSKIIKLDECIFYDFGSGYGKVVDYFSKICKKSVGIEIDNKRYIKSLEYKSDNALFYNDNFFNIKINSPNIILVNNLCLGMGTNKRLSEKILNECQTGDLILVTKKMNLLNENFLNEIEVKCSWGISEVYIYMITKN